MRKPGKIAVAFAKLGLRALSAPKRFLALLVLSIAVIVSLAYLVLIRPILRNYWGNQHYSYYPHHRDGAVGGGRFATVVELSKGVSHISVFEQSGGKWIANRLDLPKGYVGGLGLSENYLVVPVSSPLVECGWLRDCAHVEEFLVFRREVGCLPENGNCWHPDASFSDFFPVNVGSRVALSGDNLAVLSFVFGPDHDRVLRIYHRSDSGWILEHQEPAEELDFALHQDRLLVSAEKPRLYQRDKGKWTVVTELVPAGEEECSGRTVALSESHALVRYREHVHLYSRDSQGAWVWEAKLSQPARFPEDCDTSDEFFSWGYGLAFDGERPIVSYSVLADKGHGIGAVIFGKVDNQWQPVDFHHYNDPSGGIGMFIPFSASNRILIMGHYGVAVFAKDSSTNRFGAPQVPGEDFPM